MAPSRPLTPDEQELLQRLCLRVIEEKDFGKLEEILTEMLSLLDRILGPEKKLPTN